MSVEILHRPASAVAKISFEQGERWCAEAGAMVAMSSEVEVSTSTHSRGRGGLFRGLRRLISGESFFLNHYSSPREGSDLYLASALPGDMEILHLGQDEWVVQSGSFVGCQEEVELELSWQGLKSIFSGEGLFWLKLNGPGQAVVHSFGQIYPVDVEQSYTVDTAHIVAFPRHMSFKIRKFGKTWLQSFTSGEGLAMEFKGKGRIWCQSHAHYSFGRSLTPFLKPRRQ